MPFDDRDSRVDFLTPERHISLPESNSPSPVRPERRGARFSFLKVSGFILGLFALSALALSYGIARTTPTDIADSVSFFSSFRRLVLAGDASPQSADDDRINVLLLGIGGSGHDGPELTDTIIFASYRPSTNEVGMISIPRDLNVLIDGYGYRKINHVNAYAELEKSGSGPQATAEALEEIFDEEIDYTIKVDFDGFSDIIDAVGGVSVYVDRSFSDPTYPLDDGLGSVQSVSFTEGWAQMDGEMALIYSRSRHGTNGEGSDFARAARQQKIILALKDKLMSMGVLLNPGKLNNILSVVMENVKTNISAWDAVSLAKYIPEVSTDTVTMHVIDGRSGLVYETSLNGAYVLLPVEDDWSDFKALADAIFEPDATSAIIANPPLEPDPTTVVTVAVKNGTGITGLASRTAQLLESSGFIVESVGNSVNASQANTIVYDFTQGTKDDALAALKEYLDAEVKTDAQGLLKTTALVPDGIYSPEEFSGEQIGANVDFLIMLGTDSADLVLR
ncbi:LCP family protein [Patescibacteria group bacterium]|nr:LCP family protein [Patescibacteria group bacterium]